MAGEVRGWRIIIFCGAVAAPPFFLASQGVNPHPKPIRWWVYKTNENLKKEKVLLEISLEVPMAYGCLSLGCTWYDYDTAKSQQAKPAPSHQQDGSGLSGVYAYMHTAPSPSSGCRQSHSRAGPSTSVVATEVSHCVFACLPSGFRLRVFPFLDTSQNQRERAVELRTLALVRQTKLLSTFINYKMKKTLSSCDNFIKREIDDA